MAKDILGRQFWITKPVIILKTSKPIRHWMKKI